jgi:hypothetical protein
MLIPPGGHKPKKGHSVIHTGALKNLVSGTAAVLALAAAGLTVTAATAMAASATPTSVSMNTQLKTATFAYACNFSGYGGSAAAPVEITASLTAPDSVSLDSHTSVTFVTQAITLPAAVSKDVPALSSMELGASAATSGTDETPVEFLGSSGPVAAGATQIPAITALSDPLTFTKTGTALISEPGVVTLTPFVGGKALTAISCPSPVASVINLAVAVTTPPGTVVGNYLCGVPIGEPTSPYQIPVGITVSGPGRNGTTDTVTLNVPAPADASGAGGPTVELKGSVPVTGAQHGSIAVAGSNSSKADSLSATGKLALTAAGTDHIGLPTAFQVIDPTGGPTFAIFFCTLNGPQTSTGPSLRVASVPPALATASATPIPSTTPVGAPATGGGSGPGADVALAIAGAAGLAVGTAMVLMAVRRRKAQQSAV